MIPDCFYFPSHLHCFLPFSVQNYLNLNTNIFLRIIRKEIIISTGIFRKNNKGNSDELLGNFT